MLPWSRADYCRPHEESCALSPDSHRDQPLMRDVSARRRPLLPLGTLTYPFVRCILINSWERVDRRRASALGSLRGRRLPRVLPAAGPASAVGNSCAAASASASTYSAHARYWRGVGGVVYLAMHSSGYCRLASMSAQETPKFHLTSSTKLLHQHPNVYRSTAAFGPLAENPKRPELRAVSGSGAYRDRTGDLRLAKPNPSFLHQPGLGGIPGASRPFTRCFTGIAGRRRGLPPISCGMQAG
jgi:hypothetical protein